MKLTGSQLKAFWAAPFDELIGANSSDAYFEDELITVDGAQFDPFKDIDKIDDGARCIITGGAVIGDPKGRSVEALARAWLKAQTTMQLIIEFDKTDEKDVREMLMAHGLKTVG